MAKGVFNASVFTGRPLYPSSVSTLVTVYDADTGLPVPTLWLDRDGAEELSNPHGLPEDGVILFYANPGRYNIEASLGLSLVREWPDVIISDAATSGGGGIESVVAGTNITVDDTDPVNPIVSSTGGGATNFTDLDDVPASYSGQAGELVRVNFGETALEFAQFGPPLSVDSVSASYTLSLAIWNQIKNITGSGTVDITIPLDSTLDLPIGYTHIVRPRNSFSGTCTWVKADVSMTLEAPDGGTLVCGPNMASAATKIAANTWIIYGVTEAA
jgi:hypothetical protein